MTLARLTTGFTTLASRRLISASQGDEHPGLARRKINPEQRAVVGLELFARFVRVALGVEQVRVDLQRDCRVRVPELSRYRLAE